MQAWGWWKAGVIAVLLGAVAGCGVSEDSGTPGAAPVQQVAGLGTRTLTFTVAADTWADESAPDTNRGTATVFKSDGSPRGEAFLRFDVSGIGGATVRRATLRLYAVNPSSDGPEVYAAGNTWAENTLTWRNRPARVGGPSADAGAIFQDTWVGLDVTPIVRADGTVSIMLLQTYSDGAEFLSREAGRNPPQLVLEVEDPGEGTTLRFSAEADTHVQEAQPSTNFGGASALEVDGSPQTEAYLRFRLAGLSGRVVSAKLRLFSTNPTSQGPALYSAAASWDERTVTWASRPARQGSAVATLGAVALNEWVELDVTPLVTGNGVLSVALVARATDGVDFSSREAVGQKPELVVTLAGTEPPPTGETRTLGAVADAYTDDAFEYTNFNTEELRVDTSPSRLASFLRFDLSGLQGDVASAKLRLFVLNGTSDGPAVWTTRVNWSETSVIYANEPYAQSGPVANAGAASVGTWLELDVTGAFLGGPLVSFALLPESSDGVSFASNGHSNAALRPQLVVTTRVVRCTPSGGDTPASGTYRGGQSWGGPGHQAAYGVAADGQGNRIFIAAYEGSVDFGGGPLPNNGTGDISDNDLALVKLRPDGSHVWSKGFGAPGSWVDAWDVATDAAGNIAVVGRSSAGVNLGGGVIPPGAFVAKFSPQGTFLWARNVDGGLKGVTFDSAGNVLAVGDTARPGSPPDSGSNELLVFKLSPTGAQVWFHRFQATILVRGEAIATGPSNEVVVGGTYSGTVAFGTSSLPQSTGAPFLVKLSSAGPTLWSRGILSSDYPYYSERGFLDLAVAPDGAIAGVGYFSHWIRLGSQTAFSTGFYSGFVSVMEPDGTDRWWRWMGNESDTFARGVAIDSAGDVVVMGTYRATLNFGGGPLTTAPGFGGPYEGVFVAKYRLTCGEHRWSQQLSHGVFVWTRGLAVAPDRSITVSGEYQDSFGPGLPADPDRTPRALLLHLSP
jgi:hypothetical protein